MSFVGTYSSPVLGIVLSCILEDKFCMPNDTIHQFPFVCQTFTVLFIVLLHFINQRVLVLPIVLLVVRLNSLSFSRNAVSYLIFQHPYFFHNAVSYSTFQHPHFFIMLFPTQHFSIIIFFHNAVSYTNFQHPYFLHKADSPSSQ